jgi:hypothetical protein
VKQVLWLAALRSRPASVTERLGVTRRVKERTHAVDEVMALTETR